MIVYFGDRAILPLRANTLRDTIHHWLTHTDRRTFLLPRGFSVGTVMRRWRRWRRHNRIDRRRLAGSGDEVLGGDTDNNYSDMFYEYSRVRTKREGRGRIRKTVRLRLSGKRFPGCACAEYGGEGWMGLRFCFRCGFQAF